ncbi:MAG: M48 family metalloprotease [Casimicrobiaceae bacterium]
MTAAALAFAPLYAAGGSATVSEAAPQTYPQRLPDLGDVSQTDFSPAQERKLGETIVRQLRASGGYINDPEVNDYLNELGHRLIAASTDVKQDFEFFGVPDPQINAFALPGGFIGVNTGLILLAQTESELASVLAHEISHVTQHHLARALSAQKDSMLMSLAGLALAVLAARGGGNSSGDAASAAIAATQALTVQHQINFTRENEYEADRLGFQRLDAAGFDVTAMATFMQRLQTAMRFVEGNVPTYLRDHPVTYERIAEAQARAYGHPYRQVVDSLDFHLVRALIRSYQGEPREAVKWFDDAIAEHKYNNAIAEQYGLVASLLRTTDFDRAKKELAKLEKIAPRHPMIDAIAGHVLLESGDINGAIKRFEAGVARYPNKMQLVYDYPDALLKGGRNVDAAKFVEQQLARFPSDGPLQLLAARAYAAQNQQMLAHRHQAEYYAWQGNLKGAIDQLEIASKAKDGDFYQASVIDTRLRALRREVADQGKSAFGKPGLNIESDSDFSRKAGSDSTFLTPSARPDQHLKSRI